MDAHWHLFCGALRCHPAPVDDDAFETIAKKITDGFQKALAEGPLDGLYLDLHGAMVTPNHHDAEGELLRRLRAIAPEPFPIVCSLDLHANVSGTMVEQASLIDAYRTYPHVDMAETGARTMNRLVAMITSGTRPKKLFRPIPFLVTLDAQCTLTEPMRGIAAAGRALENEDGVDCVAQCFGFPLADIEDAGPSLLLYGPGEKTLTNVADRLEATWIEKEQAFGRQLPSAGEAVRQAMIGCEEPGPVVIADTQDNPGGGGTGDTTGMIHALLEAHATGAVVVHIADPEAAEAAHCAGTGGKIDTSLGGKQEPAFGPPVPGPFTVQALGSGSFIGIGPMYRGNRIELGPVALLEREGIRIIVAPRKMQASEPALLHHLGLDPAEIPVLVVKSSVHFRGAYQDMASRIIPAIAPGPVTARLDHLSYRHAKRRIAGARKENINA
ncbi:M81 family metallopeptidase [Nitratireductor sp. GISD-1A_MAKvit]|uniref:M81 family metallopeptidase n=1 Tax=Nitratireductor sp. GISD-1A_MAKvit TaxID=3234198 RepID=UPI0034659688